MSSLSRLLRRSILALLASTGGASLVQAQLITPKTVPVKQGEQFGVYPSQYPGLGGIGIALQDTIGDPWGNPAKATRLTSGWLNVMPFTHHATDGGGRSLPVSMLQKSGNYAGGMLYSMQQVERRSARWDAPISERTASNQYFSGIIARKFGEYLSVGFGLSTAELRGVDGVSALYAGNDRLRQSGGTLDARLGLTRDFTNGATLEMVGAHYRYGMTHDVHFPTQQIWSPETCDCPPVGPCNCTPLTVPARDEHHKDRTRITGLQAMFVAPRTSGGWRLGYLVTASTLSHPKLPDYQLPTVQVIPRDPGNTNAFNIGFGAVRTMGRSIFGINVIKEPMWSHTWADAARDTTAVNGSVIRAGQHTVDNHFTFSNSRINIGVGQEVANSSDSSSVLSFQFGLSTRMINYTLDQTNHVTRTSRTQDEGWTEWTRMFAIKLGSEQMSVTYSWSNTCGPDCPTFAFSQGDDVSVTPPAADPTVLPPPDSPLRFGGGTSGRHRFMVSIRLK